MRERGDISVKTVKVCIFGLGLWASSLLSTQGNPVAGKDIFKAKCAECHNADSKEVKEGPGLLGVKDGKLPSGKKATHDAILDVVSNGQDSMPGFKDTLTVQQREDVTAYVMTL
jgi:mono/diheme cytochrome c family protein